MIYPKHLRGLSYTDRLGINGKLKSYLFFFVRKKARPPISSTEMGDWEGKRESEREGGKRERKRERERERGERERERKGGGRE